MADMVMCGLLVLEMVRSHLLLSEPFYIPLLAEQQVPTWQRYSAVRIMADNVGRTMQLRFIVFIIYDELYNNQKLTRTWPASHVMQKSVL